MRRLIFIFLCCVALCGTVSAQEGSLFDQALKQYLSNNYSDAVSNLRVALQADPNNWKARQLLGYCAFQMNDPKDGLSECQESLRLNGDNPRLKNFADWLRKPEPREPRPLDQGDYFEGSQESQMPPPPDLASGPESNEALSIMKVPAPTPTPSADFFRNFRLQMGFGVDFPAQNFDDLGHGIGGELGLGYALDDHWSIWLTGDIYSLPENDSFGGLYYNYNFSFFEMALAARYLFGNGLFQPYAGAGVGINVLDYWDNSYPMVQGILGAKYRLGDGLSLFLEAKENFNFENYALYNRGSLVSGWTTSIDIPVNAGLIFDLGEGKGSHSRGQVPQPPSDNFFIKAGGGFALAPDNFLAIPVVATTSMAFGYDFPGHFFSCFISAERLPGDLAALANIQFTLPTDSFLCPYVFGGFGVDLPSGPAGPTSQTTGAALQFGLGLEFHPPGSVGIFAELKDYASTYYDPFVDNLLGNSLLLMGLKCSLPESLNPPPEKTPPPGSFPSRAFVELAGGADIPALHWQPAYGAGSGGKFSVGYKFRDGLALQLDVEDFDFSGVNFFGTIQDHELLVLPTVRYLFGHGIFHPYLSAGMGLEVETSWGVNTPNGEVANPDLALGAGVEVSVDDWISLFAEGKYNFVFSDGVTGQDLPILAGGSFGFE